MLEFWNIGVLAVPWIQGLIALFFPIISSFPYSTIPPKDVNVRFCYSLLEYHVGPPGHSSIRFPPIAGRSRRNQSLITNGIFSEHVR